MYAAPENRRTTSSIPASRCPVSQPQFVALLCFVHVNPPFPLAVQRRDEVGCQGLQLRARRRAGGPRRAHGFTCDRVHVLAVVLDAHREVVLVVLEPTDDGVRVVRHDADAPSVATVREVGGRCLRVQDAEGTAATIAATVTPFGNNATLARGDVPQRENQA